MEAAEVKELQNSLRSLFETAGDDPAAVPTALDELGWDDVVAEDPRASTLLFEEIGRAGVSVQLLDVAMLDDAGYRLPRHIHRLPADTASETCSSPRSQSTATPCPVQAVVRTLGTAPERVLIPIGSEPTVGAAGSHGRAGHSRGGRTRSGGRLGSRDPAADTRAVVGGAHHRRVERRRRVGASAARGRVGGPGAGSVALAADHVTQRQQFGRSIGSFQSVRFRLADTKAAIEAAAEAIRVADVDNSPLSAAIAKALAGAAADSAVRNAAQVCGAMGLTWEFGLHSIIRRSYALDVLLGSTAELIAAFGRRATDQATPVTRSRRLTRLSCPPRPEKS